MRLCEFKTGNKGDTCMVCGYALTSHCPTPPVRNCGNTARQPPCPHLGPQRTNKEGVKLKVKCGCSKKHQERQVPAHTCEVFKRCLPSVRFDQKQIEEWNQRDESAMYAICQLCPIQEG